MRIFICIRMDGKENKMRIEKGILDALKENGWSVFELKMRSEVPGYIRDQNEVNELGIKKEGMFGEFRISPDPHHDIVCYVTSESILQRLEGEGEKAMELVYEPLFSFSTKKLFEEFYSEK